jgi:chromosome segregation ATPase
MSVEVVYLEVTSLRGTFRRAGFTFDTTAKVIECSPEQAERIRAETGKALKVRDAQPGEAPVEVTLASLDDRIASLKSENTALSKANADASERIAELEAIAAKAHAEAAEARKGCDELAKQLADAREANAKLSADLEAATAPKPKPEPKPAK